MGAGCQGNQSGLNQISGLELSIPRTNFQEGERGWRLNQSQVTSVRVQHGYVMKPP